MEQTQASQVAQEGEMLKLVRSTWQSVLELPPERIGDDANFFSLGGSSLQAMIIVRLLSESLGTEVPTDIIVSCQTPLATARHLMTLPVTEGEEGLL